MSLFNQVVQHPRFANRDSEYIRWYPKSLSPIHVEPKWKSSSVRGAYIHVPFCDKICRFCPFNKTVTQSETVARYVAALLKEIRLLSNQLGRNPLYFIYFGGGTPSVLDSNQIASILSELDNSWGLAKGAEVTLETHPTHANIDHFRNIAAAGVTRISIGIQSFDNRLLKILGATHEAKESRKVLEAATRVFDNVAIDLLYYYRGQTIEDWREDLRIAIGEYQIPHLSCYALVPFGTINDSLPPENEISLAIEALDFGETHGLHHYASCASGGFDIARPSYQCHYELEHWKAPQSEFIGLGPGAFGFAGHHSTVNRLAVSTYCSLLENHSLPLASAVEVDQEEMRHRYFTIGVKTLEVPTAPYKALFARNPLKDFSGAIQSLIAEGFAEASTDSVKLTPLGRLYVDTCSTFFFSEAQREVPHPEEPEIRVIEQLLREPNIYEPTKGTTIKD